MRNRKFLRIATLLFLTLSISATIPSKKANKLYISNYENVLGTSLEIKVSATSAQLAEEAETAGLLEIDRLNNILSGYDANSEFSRWLASPKNPVKVSEDLFNVLKLYDKWRVQSGGALDASAQVISAVWKEAEKNDRQPTEDEITAAVQQVKQVHWKLDETNQTALRMDDSPLILNSFTKSYIIDKAADAMMSSKGISSVVVNIGGDIMVKGDHLEEIHISDPKADAENDAPISKLSISNKTVATSGNYRRGEMINGQWYSHIVDPRTGKPAEKVISATVVADNATDAGALATAFNVLSPQESKTLASTIPGTEYLIITSDGKREESAGWKSMENSVKAIAETADKRSLTAADKTWDPNYELQINFELKRIDGFRSQRPYVAVWIVDKNKKPVRSIALWFNKSRYLNDMRSWYSSYYDAFSKQSASVTSTTSATRPPGKYTLKWDGKDDKGQLVKLDAYTVMMEFAREHGTYQLVSRTFDFTKGVNPVTIPGNPEIESASIIYSKKN